MSGEHSLIRLNLERRQRWLQRFGVGGRPGFGGQPDQEQPDDDEPDDGDSDGANPQPRISESPANQNGQRQPPRRQNTRPNQSERPQQSPPTGSCVQGTSCIGLNECPFISFLGEQDKCQLGGNAVGICCPIIDDRRGSDREAPSRPVVFPDDNAPKRRKSPFDLIPTSFPIITPKDLIDAANKAIRFMLNLDATENELDQKQLFAEPGSSENDLANFNGNNKEAIKIDRDGQVMLKTALELVEKLQLSPEQSETAFKSLSFANTLFKDNCPKNIRCPRSSKYRTIDGSCNNEQNADWGKAFTAFNRIVHPNYADNFDAPRVAKSGQPLPGAREVSFTVAPDSKSPNNFMTMMVMQWGTC